MATHLVIMVGGSGTRFWPKSTSKKPKQLLAFSQNGPTLLKQTLDRFDGLVPGDPGHRMIVTTQLLQQACAAEAKQVNVLAGPPTGRAGLQGFTVASQQPGGGQGDVSVRLPVVVHDLHVGADGFPSADVFPLLEFGDGADRGLQLRGEG